ncbi:NAD(P)-dependent alcohol dehydrogenase [Cryptosporangium sp. NPDC051539]|uniref:NAD(P)-dependent alcohol dehydrogenase n=1 Tax=Cryptosporangium sp. NPDC051539 TaxID=3363962 RepID=UPI0037AAA42A
MIRAHGYAAHEPGGALVPFAFTRRDPGPGDVVLRITHCGICHSDERAVSGWMPSAFPLVPGHEIIGEVTAVGADVRRFRGGDRAGVGCLVDSCRACPACDAGDEHACHQRATPTYGGRDRITGEPTQGGYADVLVVDERYALRVPSALDPAGAAPLLCAGITTYSPLRHWGVGPGHVVGVAGLGGLGHLGVKFAKAFGAEVVVLTTSAGKAAAAIELGADRVVVSTSREQMRAAAGSLDFLLDTVSAPHDVNAYLSTLRRDGTLCLLGIPAEPFGITALRLIGGRRSLTGSAIGGIRETQEMLGFCAEHGISTDVELIRPDRIGEAFDRMLHSDVRYRFVLDLGSPN